MKEAAMRSVNFTDRNNNDTFTDTHLEKFDKKMAYDVEMYAMHNVMYSTVNTVIYMHLNDLLVIWLLS